MKNLYYATVTTQDTDGSDLVFEWYYYEHDFGGVEIVSEDTEDDYHTNMTGKQWISNLKKYYPDMVVAKVL